MSPEDAVRLRFAKTGTSADGAASAPAGGPVREAPRGSRVPGTSMRFGFLKAGFDGGK